MASGCCISNPCFTTVPKPFGIGGVVESWDCKWHVSSWSVHVTNCKSSPKVVGVQGQRPYRSICLLFEILYVTISLSLVLNRGSLPLASLLGSCTSRRDVVCMIRCCCLVLRIVDWSFTINDRSWKYTVDGWWGALLLRDLPWGINIELCQIIFAGIFLQGGPPS